MLKNLKALISSSSRAGCVTTESSTTNITNKGVKLSQVKLLAIALISILILGILLLKFISSKVEAVGKQSILPETLKHELADKALDPEKMWRNYHEEDLKIKTDDLLARIKKVEENSNEANKKLIEEIRAEVSSLKAQLEAANSELVTASQNLARLSELEQDRLSQNVFTSSALDEETLIDDETTYDIPKSAADYIPEGTYFTGYLLTGLAVSTALNTPSENAVPLTIRLQSRGNLAQENDLDISKCQITGSAYGDLSSERAVVRLEKMVCKNDGMYITTHIAGDVHGPDGLNGIKGTVVSTGTRHIKNAMIGGIIGGLSQSAKGQGSTAITSGGILSTEKQGFGELSKQGLLSGTSNAGEKIADYYLRQAESMSPVLTVPGGVRVNAHITKGFFVGETSTHKKIKIARSKAQAETQANTKEDQNDW